MSLHLHTQHLETILAAFPDPVFILTRNGRYAAVYGGTDARYYHDGSGLVGKNLYDVLKPEKAEWFLGEIAKTLDTGGLHIVEYGLSGNDVLGLDEKGPANVIWFEGRVQALDFLMDGEDAVLWVASNITHRITIEMQLSDALQRERKAIDVMWKRMAQNNTPKLAARWTLDVTSAQLKSTHAKPIALTANEMHLLASLTEAEGGVVSKDVLFARMFPGVESKDYERIDVTLSRLRQKLKRHDCELVLRSVFGKGIALTENVHITHAGMPAPK